MNPNSSFIDSGWRREQVREAWLQAQQVANKELVDSEVRQAMTRMAEVFAEDVAAEERLAASLLLWPAQQLQVPLLFLHHLLLHVFLFFATFSFHFSNGR